MADAIKEMSLGPCRGSAMITAARRKVLARATGNHVQPGLVRLHAQLV